MKRKKYLKLLLCLLLAFAQSITLIGCSAGGATSETEESIPPSSDNDPFKVPSYNVVEVNGQHYIVLEEPFEYHVPGLITASIGFDTMQEFKEFTETITKGQLDYYQMGEITIRFKKNEIGVMICDLDHLYEPVLPPNFSVVEVLWQGTDYSFILEPGEGGFGHLSFLPQDGYQELYRRGYDKYFSESPTTTTDTHPITGEQNGITYQYTYNSRVGFLLKYMLYDGTRAVEVHKRYLSSEATVPSNITLYGQEEGEVYYIVDMCSDIDGGRWQNDPSDGWLLEFGLKPYVDPDDAV